MCQSQSLYHNLMVARLIGCTTYFLVYRLITPGLKGNLVTQGNRWGNFQNAMGFPNCTSIGIIFAHMYKSVQEADPGASGGAWIYYKHKLWQYRFCYAIWRAA